jgi:hypothetical protein
MSLYDMEILEWSEQQAALLLRVVAGKRLNNATPDWGNIIEEVESVGQEAAARRHRRNVAGLS